MERVAFISDIHSNLPALEAVIDDIRSKGIDRIYCLGDISGYHSQPNLVIDLLKSQGVISIKGNHDMVITEKKFNREKPGDFVLWWNYDELTEENLKYLYTLPEELVLEIEDKKVKIVHGSPESIEEYIREGSREVHKYIDTLKEDVLICGHTHLPYIFKKDGKFLLNTGSVGKPKVGKPESSYVIVSIADNEITPEIVFVKYDVQTIVTHLRKNSFPEKYIEALITGNP